MAWNQKSAVLIGVMALLSLSMAHYAGFLMSVPLSIVAVAGPTLAGGVTATFLFYMFFCLVIARVLAAMMQLITLPVLPLIDRIAYGFALPMTWEQRRRFVRKHTETITWEGGVWALVRLILFLLCMLALYVEFTMTWVTALVLLGSVMSVVLSGLFKAGFALQLKPRTFFRKIKTRPTRMGGIASAAFVTITGASVITGFLMGGMRAELLRSQQPHMVTAKDFKGMAAIIASSNGSLLLYQKQDEERRYIYTAPEFSASWESRPAAASH